MGRTILSVFLLSICMATVLAAAGVNYWSPIGPDGGTVKILTAAPSRWVWAGSRGGLFWSHDGGAHWHPATADILGRIWDVVIDPVHPDTLYVASVKEVGILRELAGSASPIGS